MIDIAQIDDETAQRILTTIARVRSGALPKDSRELRKAMVDEFTVGSGHAISGGELARQALLVLAEDPATRIAIETMAGEGEPGRGRTYDGGASIALGVAAYYALSTAVEISRDQQGKWSFKMRVKPAGEAAVRKLVEKLVGYLPG